MSWESFYTASEFQRQVGQQEIAAEHLEQAANHLLQTINTHPTATYDNALALASILLNNYHDFDRAERVYKAAIERKPRHYAGYHELAATLQGGGKVQEALQLVENFQKNYGMNDSAENDRLTLENAMTNRPEPIMEKTPPQ